ncbi:MAG TPA: hypothetical protein PKN95_05360 [Verrucomicrobiota bacterium]|nr:hypothetical protein [Verrucomicrobiota bacterium]
MLTRLMKPGPTVWAALLMLSLSWRLPAVAQDTTITYRGFLQTEGVVANGAYDFCFSLHDAAVAGNQVGDCLTNNATPVSNGWFTVALVFGTMPFTGAPRWLEIAVRTNGAESFTLLEGRQRITAMPTAVYAIDAGSAATLTGPLPAAQVVGMLPPSQISGLGSAAYANATNFYPGSNPSNFITRKSILRRFNVMDYGASGTANPELDSPAFQAAWNDAFTYGGVVYVPRGRYVDTNSYQVPVWSATGPHSGRTGSEFFIEGDGRDATLIYVNTTNAVYLQCDGQIPKIQGLSCHNTGAATTSCLVATNLSGAAGILHDAAFRGFYKGADIAAHCGLRVTSCEFYNCYVGLRIAGFSDGVTVETRADSCRAGVVIGGLMPSLNYGKANGGRFHVEGAHNGYVYVVARSGGNILSGYTEQTSNAVVAVGYPPGLLPNESRAETDGMLQLNIESLQELVPQSSTNDFVRLYVPCLSLRISGCFGGTLIHSMTPAADSQSAWLAVGNYHLGNMVQFSNGATLAGDGGLSTYKTWSYRWKEVHQNGSLQGTFLGDFQGVFQGNGAGLSSLSADAITGGLTANLEILTSAGTTNTLCITNGVIRAIR